MRNLIRRLVGVVVLIFVSGATADVVSVPLNCAGTYDINTPAWTHDFDLGKTFSDISQIYINWSGDITAELIAPIGRTNGYPIDALFIATLYEQTPHDYFGQASVQKGDATYPVPETFDQQSFFSNEGWSALLDGQSNIEIHLSRIARPTDTYPVEYPVGELYLATLVIEGTVIPEPGSLSILILAVPFLRIFSKKHSKAISAG